MAFSPHQVRQLRAKLDGRHVRTRQHLGEPIAYLEGWHVIQEANRIFGFHAWTRETLDLACLSEDDRGGVYLCAYRAHVRVSVAAGDATVYRDGHGVGHGRAAARGEAHEQALKAAETDATKRALATFGNPFGLALYDPARRQVKAANAGTACARRKVSWTLIGADGARLGRYDDPQTFCSALRQLAEATASRESLIALWRRNQATIDHLKHDLPDLQTQRGEHYADVLQRVLRRRREALPSTADGTTERERRTTDTRQVDKSVLALPAPKRVRDPDHLALVRAHACLVCARTPTHAHHIRYAQPQAAAAKVGDDWTVPLCVTHHRSVHRTGDERAWWQRQGIDPLKAAERLWALTRDKRQMDLKLNGDVCGSRDASRNAAE
jgi:DNA recombination protein Rad52